MRTDPATRIQDFLVFGEFGDVNPSITDSSTFTFLNPEKMEEIFDHELEGCFLYSRHWNPINKDLSSALARMEDGESAQVMASGMAAISTTLMALVSAGEEIVASRTIYGGTYALLKNLLPRFGVTTRFVNVLDLAAVEADGPKTRCSLRDGVEPAAPVVPARAASAPTRSYLRGRNRSRRVGTLLHQASTSWSSMTGFINGTSDCVAGCASGQPRLHRAAQRRHRGPACCWPGARVPARGVGAQNLHSLHIRMRQHGANALALAQRFARRGLPVHYPGLETHPQHALMNRLMNPGFGYGGMLAVDVGDHQRACRLMTRMQEEKVGYLAVSLGYFKTLFSVPGHSTSSEIPAEERRRWG
jgi:methionine-gamma-lyase